MKKFPFGLAWSSWLKITGIVWILTNGCAPPISELPDQPEIELLNYEVLYKTNGGDSVIVIDLFYQDGDGDIGLTRADSLPPFNFGSPTYHNLPVRWFEPNGNNWKEIINPNSNAPIRNYHERVPPLHEGKSKAISGKIHFEVLSDPEFLGLDTVKLEIVLRDRSLNESNVVSTGRIVY